MSATRLDPDDLAALEDQREHLLTSLEDLEREHDAGDLDDDDYRALRDDYTARAAEVLRAIDEQRALLSAPRPPRRRGRAAAVAVGVLAFAVVAGVLVARGAGVRGDGTLTGNDGGLRAALANCQPLAFREPERGIRCYRRILDDTPDSVEALTYLGWALIRADRVDDGMRRLARAVELDPDYPDARVFRAVVLARAGEAARASGDAASAAAAFVGAAEELDRFFRNDPPQVAVQVLGQELLEFKVFLGLLGPATGQCWATALADRTGELDQAFYDALRRCLDDVVAADPADADARFARALAALGPDGQDLAAARADVEAVLADPAAASATTLANARLLRVSLGVVEGRFDDAAADLALLDGVTRPTASFLVGPPDELGEALEAARRAAGGGAPVTGSSTGAAGGATATTVPPVSVSTVPGAPAIPNADGG